MESGTESRIRGSVSFGLVVSWAVSVVSWIRAPAASALRFLAHPMAVANIAASSIGFISVSWSLLKSRSNYPRFPTACEKCQVSRGLSQTIHRKNEERCDADSLTVWGAVGRVPVIAAGGRTACGATLTG